MRKVRTIYYYGDGNPEGVLYSYVGQGLHVFDFSECGQWSLKAFRRLNPTARIHVGLWSVLRKRYANVPVEVFGLARMN